MKRLPGQNWSASLVPEIPRLGTGAFVTCRSGYYVWKNWDNWETSFNNGNLNTADKPIFKIEEVLLNEAEAKFELGVFDQGVADKTINKLRSVPCRWKQHRASRTFSEGCSEANFLNARK